MQNYFRGEKPLFLRKLRDKTCIEREAVKFECHLKANPPPHIMWYKDGSMLVHDEVRQTNTNRQGLRAHALPPPFFRE